MLRSALLPFLVCLAFLAPPATPLTAQAAAPGGEATAAPQEGETAGEAAAEDSGPGLLEKGGAIDQVFGDALEIVAYLPFFDLMFNAAPAYPWTSPDGTWEITREKEKDGDGNPIEGGLSLEGFKAQWPELLKTEASAELLGIWKDGDGGEFHMSVTGDPQSTKLPFVVIWLVLGALIFTLSWRFINLRMFGHAIAVVRGRYDNPDDHGEVTHFQALASALSATVGLGNIAGVAIAISIGGPGATFWMVCAGLLGMSLKFTECTLGQKFRKVDDHGNVSGGPMHYLKDGLEQVGAGGLGKILALFFTIFCIGGSLAGGNSFQVNQSLGILKTEVPYFVDNGWVYGVIMAVGVGIVIIGGIRRIAQVAEKIVPTMCGIYVVAALLVLVSSAGAIPDAFGAIFGGAFSGSAVYGGIIGSLVTGFQRAAFSNEAGVGSAAIAHSAAKTEYPVREGIVALLEPFIDTVVVCTMTALVIIITGVYDPAGGSADLVATKEGAALTKAAFETVPWMAGWFSYILLIAVILFAFSTMISWSYYGERCWANLFGPKSSLSYKLLFLVFVVLGSIVSATNVLEFGDLMILIMAFPNILGLYFLRGVVKGELTEYESKLKAGEMKTYE